MTRAGDMRHLVTLKHRVLEEDSTGSPKPKYHLIDEVWASRKTLSGDERYVNAAIKDVAQVEFFIYPIDGLETEDRIEHHSDVFEVLMLVPYPENGRQEGLRVLTKFVEKEE